ncbi:hypothetical protein BDW72DRAFT_206440 [Aspergillus terricola var. indicus]
MEFRYSTEVDPSAYETHGLDGGIRLRVHADPDNKERSGTLRAQNDWNRRVSPVANYKGGLGGPYSFIRACVPECLPERLEIVSYANEFAFLYDDKMEELIDSKTETHAQNADTVVKLLSNEEGSRIHMQAAKLQAQVITEMAAIDPERASTTEKAWTRFLQLAAHSRSRQLRTLKEYLPCRIIDAGELVWFGTLTFGMALSIRDEELELCMKLARPGYAAISLTNDLYSWNKEREEARQAGLDYVYNAIWVIMHEQSVGEEKAKRVCVEQIKYYIERYCRVVEQAKRCMWLSDDLKSYLEAVKASHVGNLVWSIYCPRYHVS